MTAVTVVEAEAEAEAVSVAAVGGEGSGANGSETGASEGAEESAAKESVFHQRQSRGERRKRQIDQTPKGHRETLQVALPGGARKHGFTHPLPKGLSVSM